MTTPLVDICIVAGRRPSLLDETLASFNRNLIASLRVGKVIANIDPIFGDAALGAETKDVVRSYFPFATINEPVQPHFCAAVQRNWRATSADFVLHLEDDWLLKIPIEPRVLDIFADPSIGQITLHNSDLEWDVTLSGRFITRHVARRILGVRIPFHGMKYDRPMFGTSPCFYRGVFVRNAASLMDLRFDPDKQMKNDTNPRMIRMVGQYRNYVWGNDDNYPIVDTGRAWRTQRGIEKGFNGVRSEWREPAAGD